MARKSVAQRIEELQDLRTGYDEDPAAKKFYDWDYRFCTAMLEKLLRKKALSKKMRAKIDLMVDEGVKSAPHHPEADEMQRLADFLINHSVKTALIDFAYKIRRGWNLSVKQKNFAAKLMEEARNIEKNGHWTPCEETRAKMQLVLKLRECYSDVFWSTHAAGANAIYTLDQYMSGKQPHISEKIWESAKHAVRGKLRLIEEPKFIPGDKCFIKMSAPGDDGRPMYRKCFGIICSDPVVHNRSVGYDVLIEGHCQTWVIDRINKR